MKYDHPKSGEWFVPKRSGWKQCCCDCGLVHIFKFKYTKNKQIEISAKRDERATGQMRRHLNKETNESKS